MTTPKTVIPFCLKDAPALIERVFPVQRLSVEAYKEQTAVQSKTLTTLGSYWKGRKPLILNKACILGCLLPATADPTHDLEIFEKLMAMDDESFAVRQKRRPTPKEILAKLAITSISEYFTVTPKGILPADAPVNWSQPEYALVKVVWRSEITENERRRIEAKMLPLVPYRDRVNEAKRPEEVMAFVHDHIWSDVNEHLGTNAYSLPELVEQLGIMRYGRRPRLTDTFCGSGQIPFEAALLGCDTYASDLNPVACMLTWGAFNIVGGSKRFRQELRQAQELLVATVQEQIDALAIETDNQGWKAKTFLYCIEVICPQTGWKVPLLPTRQVSKGKAAIAKLIPNIYSKCFDIVITSSVSEHDWNEAEKGTLLVDGRGQEPYLCYLLDGFEYKTKISTLRGDYRKDDGSNGNRLRQWKKHDFKPDSNDIFQERLYAIHWMRPKSSGKSFEYEFRAVTEADLLRERVVWDFITKNFEIWQSMGWIPDMRIESGVETERLGRERGWTYWHHLFSPRQLLYLGFASKSIRDHPAKYVAPLLIFLARLTDWSSKLCRYGTGAARESVAQTFYNQALNTLFSYAVRSFTFAKTYLLDDAVECPVEMFFKVKSIPAGSWDSKSEIFITDPPYGDAVNYDEILEFFIAWLRKNPPPEFSEWIWDSRRSLAIKGAGENFRREMVAAYKRMTECMPDNGIQVIMFTHQSGTIWADMANIVWASGLQVTAAWYVVTETESALREGSYVKGTVLLVLRKRTGVLRTTRDDLAWDIKDEVEAQVETLTGLNQKAKPRYRDENLFADADLQMAGYAAALRVLTRYSIIDGKDMTAEAIRPRIKGQSTFVDELIEFAVSIANQSLVPNGIEKEYWHKLKPAERFYLKLIEMESKGAKTLDNYQNFAKAFKVGDFKPLMESCKANSARLKSAVELDKSEMGEGDEFANTSLRAVLYAVMEIAKNIDGAEVLGHLGFNIESFYNPSTRELLVALSEFLANKLTELRPDEASAARVLCELIKSQKL